MLIVQQSSQGGVKVPTGGDGELQNVYHLSPRALKSPVVLSQLPEVSRFGEKPKPTVRVRMKENGTLDTQRTVADASDCACLTMGSACPDSGKT